MSRSILSTIVGAMVVLAGTALTNGITPRSFPESGKNLHQ